MTAIRYRSRLRSLGQNSSVTQTLVRWAFDTMPVTRAAACRISTPKLANDRIQELSYKDEQDIGSERIKKRAKLRLQQGGETVANT